MPRDGNAFVSVFILQTNTQSPRRGCIATCSMTSMEKINSTRFLALLFLLLVAAEGAVWYLFTLKH